MVEMNQLVKLLKLPQVANSNAWPLPIAGDEIVEPNCKRKHAFQIAMASPIYK